MSREATPNTSFSEQKFKKPKQGSKGMTMFSPRNVPLVVTKTSLSRGWKADPNGIRLRAAEYGLLSL
jgi:hypothetical protein